LETRNAKYTFGEEIFHLNESWMSNMCKKGLKQLLTRNSDFFDKKFVTVKQKLFILPFVPLCLKETAYQIIKEEFLALYEVNSENYNKIKIHLETYFETCYFTKVDGPNVVATIKEWHIDFKCNIISNNILQSLYNVWKIQCLYRFCFCFDGCIVPAEGKSPTLYDQSKRG